MKAQSWDVYAVKQYAFTLKRTNSYFSPITLILTFIVIILSIFLSYSTLAHLWIPRSQLPTTVSQSFSFPPTLTSVLICVKSNDDSLTVPEARFLNKDLEEIKFPQVGSEWIKKNRAQLANRLGSYFGCYDIAGFKFSSDSSSFIVQVFSSKATLFLQAISQSLILQDSQSDFLEVTATGSYSNSQSSSDVGRSLVVRIIDAAVQDSLFPASSQITKFYLQEVTAFRSLTKLPFSSSNAKFYIKLFLPSWITTDEGFDWNVRTFTVVRYDIGFIVGSLLSWVSTFTLILSFVVAPLMEKSLLLQQIESLFQLPLRLRQPSLFRFFVASIKKRIFTKQDEFVKIGKKLEALKDLGWQAKLQHTGRKLTPINPLLAEVLANQETFAPSQEKKSDGCFNQTSEQSAEFEQTPDTKKEGKILSFRRAFLRWIDSGSDEISVLYKGNGHGSEASVMLTLLFVAGFAAFLFVFGVMQIDTTTKIYNLEGSEDFLYDVQAEELVFVTDEESEIIVCLMNGNFEIVSNISLKSMSNCDIKLTPDQISSIANKGSYYYCLSSSVTLVKSLDSTKTRSLYINNANFLFSQLSLFHFSSPSTNSAYDPVNPIVSIPPPTFQQAIYYQEEIPITTIIDSSKTSTKYAELTPLRPISNGLSLLIGMNIILGNNRVIQVSSNTLFDIVQSIWGLGMICFTVLLLKLTKYINLKVKDRNMDKTRAQFRQNLCILLSKINRLKDGKNKLDIMRIKYYIKWELQRQKTFY